MCCLKIVISENGSFFQIIENILIANKTDFESLKNRQFRYFENFNLGLFA